MKELSAILAAAAKNAADESVLVTLVHTLGSTYRRPGARMLVLPGCRTIGTISGGCLEPAVARQAWDATRSGKPVLFEIESAPEDDTWGPASGCHGRLFLLAEPIAPGHRHPALDILAQSRTADRPALLVHEFQRHADGSLIPAALDVESADGTPAASQWIEEAGRAAFREFIPPRPHLLICGAGDDAQPVARIAAELDWRIDVLDSRARLATPERFPAAEHVSSTGPAGTTPLIHRHTAAVVMSHRFNDDVAYAAALLLHNLPYLGLLGPRARAQRLLAELVDRRGPQAAPTPDQLARIFSPVGLDIGAREPETIALAIIAQIQSITTGRDGRSLSAHVGPLQAPAPATPA